MDTPRPNTSVQHGYETDRRLAAPVDAAKAERVAALRSIEPELVGEHEFARPDGSAVRLADLFGDHDDLLAIHNMGRGCSYCTLWADGLIGIAPHLLRRTALVVVSADKPATLAKTIAERGWNFPCVSGRASGFNESMRFGTSEKPTPGVSSLHREDDGSIVRIAASSFCPGDDFCPVWPFFDLLKDGANGWEPR